MKAVISCGGQGTRIREASELLPKPMLPIGGKPIPWHIMKGFAAGGVNEFVLCLGYKGWPIKELFINWNNAPFLECLPESLTLSGPRAVTLVVGTPCPGTGPWPPGRSPASAPPARRPAPAAPP